MIRAVLGTGSATTTAAAALALVLLLMGPGCARRNAGVPPTVTGQTCATCGMEIRNPRFAAATIVSGRVRPFDSIECALRGAGPGGGRALYLADYATGALHRSDSLWVVRATIASPMGGGLAAFLDRREAERIAAASQGTVMPAGALVATSGSTP